ncbi:MAG: CotH kinase family protein [Bdellovibrionia bacterium]
MKKLFFLSSLVSLIAVAAHGASINELRITVDAAEYTRATATPQKYDFKAAKLSVNGAPATAAELNIRGQNCLKASRRCFGLKSETKITLNGENGLSAKSVNLVSMWEDQGYVSSRIGYEFFKSTGFFNLRTEYAEVFINDVSNGLYLVTEKPKKAVEQYVPDPFVARRGMEYRFEVAEPAPAGSKHTDAEYLAAFKTMMNEMKPLVGGPLRTRLDQTLNLELYMKWLVVNSILKNGDYTDEVFFYADTREKQIRFNVFPWDMDDLFRPPHAGAPNRRYANEIATGLLYSFENPVDVKIGTDTVLYADLKQLATPILRDRAADAVVDRVIDTVGRAIAPYLDRPTVLAASARDHGVALTKAKILKMLETRRNDIKTRRDLLKTRL